MSTIRKLRYKLATLALLVTALLAIYVLGLRSSNAQSMICADEVYEYCWAQNRPVDPNTCECNFSACLSPLSVDCTEVGNHLDASTCVCVSDPAYVGYCDNDPYALGCPRSFDTVFGNQLRLIGCTFEGYNDPCDPMIGGGDGDMCSFNSYVWCAQNGGTWSSYGCACSGLVTTNPQDRRAACESAGGTWYNPGSYVGGEACYNPSGFGQGSQCATSTDTLSSCVGSGGRWNPYTCSCAH